ncbi:MAG TPA: PAS domain-containing protein, partial [Bacteroidales bacterium]|nr:PAS domain-containing protein [Bacteroidales bacterium]
MIDREKIIEIFKASPTPTSILKPSGTTFIYVQVNDAYCEMTQTDREELIGNDLFEKFPANPDEKEPYGATRLLRSFEKVLNTRKEDKIPNIRYDL